MCFLCSSLGPKATAVTDPLHPSKDRVNIDEPAQHGGHHLPTPERRQVAGEPGGCSPFPSGPLEAVGGGSGQPESKAPPGGAVAGRAETAALFACFVVTRRTEREKPDSCTK